MTPRGSDWERRTHDEGAKRLDQRSPVSLKRSRRRCRGIEIVHKQEGQGLCQAVGFDIKDFWARASIPKLFNFSKSLKLPIHKMGLEFPLIKILKAFFLSGKAYNCGILDIQALNICRRMKDHLSLPLYGPHFPNPY